MNYEQNVDIMTTSQQLTHLFRKLTKFKIIIYLNNHATQILTNFDG